MRIGYRTKVAKASEQENQEQAETRHSRNFIACLVVSMVGACQLLAAMQRSEVYQRRGAASKAFETAVGRSSLPFLGEDENRLSSKHRLRTTPNSRELQTDTSADCAHRSMQWTYFPSRRLQLLRVQTDCRLETCPVSPSVCGL